jgi:hypothetical protein
MAPIDRLEPFDTHIQINAHKLLKNRMNQRFQLLKNKYICLLIL